MTVLYFMDIWYLAHTGYVIGVEIFQNGDMEI